MRVWFECVECQGPIEFPGSSPGFKPHEVLTLFGAETAVLEWEISLTGGKCGCPDGPRKPVAFLVVVP